MAFGTFLSISCMRSFYRPRTVGYFSTAMTRSRYAVLNHRRWVASFTLLSLTLIYPDSLYLKLWPLDALSPSRNHDASNHISWNAHAYPVRQNTRHVPFSTREVYESNHAGCTRSIIVTRSYSMACLRHYSCRQSQGSGSIQSEVPNVSGRGHGI